MSEAQSSNREHARIREAYVRRSSGGYEQRYSYFDRGNLFIIQDREKWILGFLGQCGRLQLAGLRILEVGCGTGFWLREFIKWGARPENLVEVDLIPERIAEAQKLCPSAVTLCVVNAVKLEFPSFLRPRNAIDRFQLHSRCVAPLLLPGGIAFPGYPLPRPDLPERMSAR